MPPRKTPAQSVMEAGLKRVFGQLADREGLIRESGLHQALLRIGYRPKKGEVANMIWEVDEKCDGTVTWEEFTAMFHRCMNDKTGLEPRRLFQVVEFMMHDSDNGGSISQDELMEILYARFGKEQLAARTKDLFPQASQDGLHGEQKITFEQFRTFMERVRPNRLLRK